MTPSIPTLLIFLLLSGMNTFVTPHRVRPATRHCLHNNFPPVRRQSPIILRGGGQSIDLNKRARKDLSTRHSLLTVRGGDSSDPGTDSDSDSDFDSDYDSLPLDNNDSAFTDDFSTSSLPSRIFAELQTTPPLTQFFLVSSFLSSLLGFLTSGNEYPPSLTLDYSIAIGKGQVWRLLTGFFNLGPMGLSWFLTAHFVWTYMSTLERNSFDQPYEFWTMIAFGMFSMVLGYGVLGISPKYHGHNLSTFLVYIWSRNHEGMEVNLMELFNLRAELLPWFFLGQTALLEGSLPVLDFLGIVFGHVYYHARFTGMVKAPGFVKKWYHGGSLVSEIVKGKYKEVGRDFEI